MQSPLLSHAKHPVGTLPHGPLDTICDVPGVRVGHHTLSQGMIQTGVTALTIGDENPFHFKTRAAVHVFNGFGKSAGLVQVEELGQLETPVVLTNTLSVGAASEGVVRYMLERTPEIGREAGTVNPLVFECNDGYLNNIRALAVRPEHVELALGAASKNFEQGSVGAGRGMSAFGLKGGIGSASRQITVGGRLYVVGALVLTNMGRMPDFIMNGLDLGFQLEHAVDDDVHGAEKGSIIMIVGTNLPLSERQLKRVAKRTGVALARTGSYMGHGSGDIAMAFTTADPIPNKSRKQFQSIQQLDEGRMDRVFRATVDATEAAILNSMLAAETVIGRENHVRRGLWEVLEDLSI
ncbi:P1 family peptidase [Pseudovibrio sp. SPO723]|uniref:DmpA family aminopeptidase n=1 Tax=Nesiotobacter zosterae TaxID=392721 RepID=UPI0029C46BDE|nr:P1 family peptidase [Pseudovibrio sp. SPO723]MDX5595534.1 P1 family peptidase [Pseudovibrio sp. SPO723]